MVASDPSGSVSSSLAPPDSETIEAKLVDTLFADSASIVAGFVAVMTMGFYGYLVAGHAWLLLWMAGSLIVTAGRLYLFQAYGRRARLKSPKRWADLCMAGVGLNSIGWGLACAAAVLWADMALQLMIITGQTAYVTDAAIRNNAVPRVAITQIVVPIVILFTACCAAGDRFHAFYAACVFMSFFAALKSNGILFRRTRDLIVAREAAARAVAELEEANKRLARLATTDGLTGLVNRRGLDAALAREGARADRDARADQDMTPLSLVLIDIDHFKALNDALGHQAGDACLCLVARCLEATIRRPLDLIARHGGEEFAILLPKADAIEAAATAEAIRVAVAARAIAHPTSATGVTTVSLGHATADAATGFDAATLMKRADDALYRAKAAGRNRVAAAPPSGHERASQAASYHPNQACSA